MTRSYKQGVGRFQESFLPPRVEDYVSLENPVRAIDAYVESLDVVQLGFKNAKVYSGVGQPPFSPTSLLKLYFWGYFNKIRTSRKLELECRRNLELIWLLDSLTPGYKTIADFRKDNANALKEVHRQFILFCKSLDLFGAELIAIDSVHLEGNASRASVLTKGKLHKIIEQIDSELKAFYAELEISDRAAHSTEDSDMESKLSELKSRKDQVEKLLSDWKESGTTQVSKTDPDARILQKPTGKGPATGYQIQAAVDEKNKLIAFADALVDTTDSEALVSVIDGVTELFQPEKLTVLVDGGYFSGKGIESCDERNIELYMPVPDKDKAKREAGLFAKSDFIFNAEKNCLICPNNQELPYRCTIEKRGVKCYRYYGFQKTCKVCPLRARCLPDPKSKYRSVQITEHEDAIERLRQRMGEKGEAMMRRRSGLAEHPFGTIKNHLGWTHFLVRGIEKVRGELGLIVTMYNFRRVLNIKGMNEFLAACAV